MTRPQATTAFFPVLNRAGHKPTFSSFRNEAPQPSESWFRMEASADKKSADLYIMDEIGGWWGVTAQDFVKELMALDAEQINLHLNSPGGDVFDGVAIYNALRLHSAKVTVYVEGLAASAASFIAQAGDEVVMLRGSMMMIHDASTIAWGDEKTMVDTASILSKISNSIADVYAQRAGGTMESWRDIMREEAWYTPEEAVAAKLADSVDATENTAAQDKVSDAWDLKIFNFSGRDKAPDPIKQMLAITNRAKEAPVKPKNSTDTGTGDPGTEEPTTDPTEAPAAPAAPTTEPAPAADPSEDTETPAPPATTPVENKAGSAPYFINGVAEADPKKVQAHIAMLEGFHKDTKTAARKAFVDGLASGPNPKVAASQLESIQNFVDTLSDEAFVAYKSTWDAAPTASLFGQHGGEGGGTPSGSAATATADRAEVLKDILKMHRDGGMKTESIEATASYKELKELQPEFTLNDLKK